MSHNQKSPSSGRAIMLSILFLLSIAAGAAGVFELIFALVAPFQTTNLDRQGTYYLAGLYYLFTSWTLFGIAALLRWFVTSEERRQAPPAQ